MSNATVDTSHSSAAHALELASVLIDSVLNAVIALLLFHSILRRVHQVKQATVVSAFISFISFISVVVQYDQNFYLIVMGEKIPLVRWVMWFVCTPMILYNICLIGEVGQSTALFLMTCEMMVICTGFFAMTASTPAIRIIMYIVSCLLFVSIFYVLQRIVTDTDRYFVHYADTKLLIEVTMSSWIGYPILMALGPGMGNIMSRELYDFLQALLDVLAKAGFGAVIYWKVERRHANNAGASFKEAKGHSRVSMDEYRRERAALAEKMSKALHGFNSLGDLDSAMLALQRRRDSLLVTAKADVHDADPAAPSLPAQDERDAAALKNRELLDVEAGLAAIKERRDVIVTVSGARGGAGAAPAGALSAASPTSPAAVQPVLQRGFFGDDYDLDQQPAGGLQGRRKPSMLPLSLLSPRNDEGRPAPSFGDTEMRPVGGLSVVTASPAAAAQQVPPTPSAGDRMATMAMSPPPQQQQQVPATPSSAAGDRMAMMSAYMDQMAKEVALLRSAATTAAGAAPTEVGGWLNKRSAWVKDWRRRWVVLKGDRLFFHKEPGSEAHSAVDLSECVAARAAEEKLGKKFGFEVTSLEAACYLQAESHAEMEQWLARLTQCIDAARKRSSVGGVLQSMGVAPPTNAELVPAPAAASAGTLQLVATLGAFAEGEGEGSR